MTIIDEKLVLEPPPYTVASAANTNTSLDTTPAAGTSTEPISEKEWRAKLKKLEKSTRKYNWGKRSEETAILESMRDLARSHHDPEVQAYWNERADMFEKAPDSDKKAVLVDIARGIGLLIAAPFAIAGAVLIGTGLLLKASGSLLTGSGNFLSGGQVGKATMGKPTDSKIKS